MVFEKWGNIVFFVAESISMDKNNEGYKWVVSAVRAFCKKNYEMKLDNTNDVTRLHDLIVERKLSISLSTLKRIFSNSNSKQKRVYNSTLDILAQFIGFKNVNDFFYQNRKQDNNSSHFC